MTSHGKPWILRPELRRWQRTAVDAWLASDGRGIAKVVTGAGKTVFAQQCMLEHLRRTEDPRFVIVVPTLALVDQWFVSLREDLGVEENQVAIFAGGKRPAARLVNLMSLNTARSAGPRVASERAMLIADECHRAATPKNAQALSGPYAATLGLSATPEREYDEGLADVLIPRIGPVFYEYDYNAAARDGVIAPFDLVNVQVELRPREQQRYDALTKQAARLAQALKKGDDVRERLRRILINRAAVSATAAMRIPVAISLAETNRPSKTLIFHERVAAATELATILAKRGARATLYHSALDPVVRRDNLRLYRRGAFDVLVTCRALDEGVNVPETTIAIIASATASNRQRIQRLGRVLRPAPGKRSAIIYTLFATEPEAKRLRLEEEALVGARSVKWMESTVRPRAESPS